MDRIEPKLPELMTRIGRMAWTAAWMEVLDQAGPLRGHDAKVGDIISPLVTELITYEVLSQQDAA